jgi:molybdenum cofactor cytidylyltransferase
MGNAAPASGRVAGIVLAAGLSTRMGENKLLISLAGETVAAHAVRTALDAGLDPVLVVVGHEAARVSAAVAHLPVIFVENPDPAAGQHTSVRAGFEALVARGGSVDAAVVMLADMPFVSAGLVRRLVKAWRAAAPRPPLAVSLHGEQLAPPILYGAALFPELRALDGGAAKRVIAAHRKEALELHFPDWTGVDLDAPEDLARMEILLDRVEQP